MTGPFQLLHGVIGDIPLGTGLDPTNVGEFVAPDINLSSGAASFQISVFTDGAGGGYTTLYADAAGIAGDIWHSSQSYGTIVADAPMSLADLVAQMNVNYEILAFGFNVIAGDTTSVVSLEWAGDKYWFLPGAPTAAVTPTSLTEAEFAASGVSATFTGYVPGEIVDIVLSNSGNTIGPGDTAVADVNGVVTYTVPAALALPADDYTVFADALAGSKVFVGVPFSVTAALAATGVDLSGPLALGGALLAGGIVLMLVTQRRKHGATAA